jgi:cellulose synthase/poly-beta-1,6-N-acetylglucosamine synthase-like glycosyltransferase
MKISVAIPCTPHHFVHSLTEVLKAYESGIIVPDEVVVSLSEAPRIKSLKGSEESRNYLSLCVQNKVFKEFKILSHLGRKTHGPNRQAASMASSGDVIIYGDADDIPHPQRVQVLAHCFESTDALHINHWWCHETCEFVNFNLEDIGAHTSDEVNRKMIDPFSHPNYPRVGYGDIFGRTHGGNTAVRREVLEEVGWKDWGELGNAPAEDWLFCYEVASRFRKSVIVPVDLIKYSGGAADALWARKEWHGNGSIKSIGAV